MEVAPKTVRLTRENYDALAEVIDRQFWRDVVGAHLASLKLMTTVRHLIIDSRTYLAVLPPVVTTWTCEHQRV